MKRKAISLLLTFVMILTMLPLSAYAEDEPLAEAETLSLTPGDTTSELNLNWYSSDEEQNNVSKVKFESESGEILEADGEVIDAIEGKKAHKVTIEGLEPGTTYSYQVSSDGSTWSKTYSYSVADEGSFKFAFVGDPQLNHGNQDNTSNWFSDDKTTKNGWETVLNRIEAEDVDLIVSAGDQVDSAYSADDRENCEAEYTDFFSPSLMQSLPFAPAVGNHDRSYNFTYHFNLPNEQEVDDSLAAATGSDAEQAAAETAANYFYYFNNTLFVVLNSSAYPQSAEQAQPFIEAFEKTIQAAIAAHPDYQWLIVQHHKSTASVAQHVADRDIQYYVEAGFERLMDEYQVDLVLAGHDHVYARSHIMRNGQRMSSSEDSYTNPNGTMYLTCNTSSGLKYYNIFDGNKLLVKDNTEYPILEDGTVGSVEYMKNKYPLSTDVAEQFRKPGYTIVEVTDESIEIRTYNVDDPEEPYDTVEIIKTGFIPETLTLAPGTDTTELNLNWYSGSGSNQAAMVQFTSESGEVITAEGTVEEATEGKLAHKVTVTGLKPDTAYTYRVSNDGEKWSADYRYETPSSSSFSFAFVGDPQLNHGKQDNDSEHFSSNQSTAQGWQDTMKQIQEADVDFVASAGDQVNTADSETQYTDFFAPASLRNLPFAPVVGNHDRSSLFSYHFNVPNEQEVDDAIALATGSDAETAAAETAGNYYYSYNNALFVVLNDSAYPQDTEQAKAFIDAFDKTIAAAKQAYPDYQWLFVQHHKSTASVAQHVADRDIQYYVEAGFEALMDKHEVDFVMAGHDHVYVRSYAMKNGERVSSDSSSLSNPEGTVYFTANTASGLKYYNIFDAENLYVKDNTEYPYLANGLTGSEEYLKGVYPLSTNVAVQDKKPGYTIVKVSGDRVTFETYSSDSAEPIDEFTVTKGGTSSETEYTITVEQSESGKISPGTSTVMEYTSKRFTITPAEGYQIADVLVDGESVGAVSEYIFENIRANHRIQAVFEKTNSGGEIIPDPDPEWEKFTDIDGHWAKDSICAAVENGLFAGTSETTFGPDLPMTRSMFVAVLGRLAGVQADEITAQNTFSDVDESAYYAPYVTWAAQNGIVYGISEEEFAPDLPITREQIAAMLVRYADKMGIELAKENDPVHFTDEDRISAFAAEAVSELQQAGILHGNGDSSFAPLREATRAEVAVIMETFRAKTVE